MKAHILQHVPFEGLGSIGSWLDARHASITHTRFYNNETLPGTDGLDLVVILGGPMSVNDEAALPWLRPEREFVRDVVRQGIPTVGICLGAQLIASSLGAPVYKNVHKEIGWFPITAMPQEKNCFRLPNQCRVFHWHGETFDLPAGAVRLAKSRGCENQAFQIGRHAVGLQFHLETTPESIRALVDNCRDDLVPGPYVQAARRLQQISAATYTRINSIMSELLSYVTNNPS